MSWKDRAALFVAKILPWRVVHWCVCRAAGWGVNSFRQRQRKTVQELLSVTSYMTNRKFSFRRAAK